MPIVDIVIPTVTTREALLERAIWSYEHHSVNPVRIHTVKDMPGSGFAWNAGAAWFQGMV